MKKRSILLLFLLPIFCAACASTGDGSQGASRPASGYESSAPVSSQEADAPLDASSEPESGEAPEPIMRFTDGMRSVPPTQLEIGDEFLDWTLIEVGDVVAYYGEDKEPMGWAAFEGSLWVKGVLSYETDYYPFGEIILFYPEDDSVFPRWSSDNREGGIWTAVGCSALSADYDFSQQEAHDAYYNDLKDFFGLGDESSEYECELLITGFVADSRPMAVVDQVDVLEVKRLSTEEESSAET